MANRRHPGDADNQRLAEKCMAAAKFTDKNNHRKGTQK
jgi:hypothetical protein